MSIDMQIIVAGDPSNEETQKLVKCINETYLPFKVRTLIHFEWFAEVKDSSLAAILMDKTTADYCIDFRIFNFQKRVL